jgi:hypothetical protein
MFDVVVIWLIGTRTQELKSALGIRGIDRAKLECPAAGVPTNSEACDEPDHLAAA